jgi:hypothetical protein
MGLSWRRRMAMTLIRVNETESGGEFLILNLRTITRVECRNFGQEQDRHQATVSFPTVAGCL